MVDKIDITPHRHHDETYEQYRERRKLSQVAIDTYLKFGRLFWPSSRAGTYRKKDHE